MEKNTPDLFQLMLCLDQLLYFSMHCKILEASCLVALENCTISLAYITWLMAGLLLLVLTPLIFLLQKSWFKILDRT